MKDLSRAYLNKFPLNFNRFRSPNLPKKKAMMTNTTTTMMTTSSMFHQPTSICQWPKHELLVQRHPTTFNELHLVDTPQWSPFVKPLNPRRKFRPSSTFPKTFSKISIQQTIICKTLQFEHIPFAPALILLTPWTPNLLPYHLDFTHLLNLQPKPSDCRLPHELQSSSPAPLERWPHNDRQRRLARSTPFDRIVDSPSGRANPPWPYHRPRQCAPVTSKTYWTLTIKKWRQTGRTQVDNHQMYI